MEQDKRAAATLRLLKIMDELREKCPWDRKQTFETLRGNTIEETYELADAILDRNMEGIREELGDLMLHIVFYSKLGAEAGAFDYADVVDGLCDKLIYRHPHVYGDIHADTPDDVKIAGIEYYVAVLRDGVRTYDAFAEWRRTHPLTGIVEWMP
mgnify:CR=1 FL=1